MDDETLKACQLAIKARIKHLNLRNSPQSERAGLLLCSHALGLLASRFIQEPDWPGHDVTDDVRLNWELQWYFDYVKAILEVSRAAQIVVRDKRLILRSQLTRTALNTKNLDDWLSRDLEAAQVDAMKGFFPGVMELCLVGSIWPDSCCLPPGAAYAQDLAAWATADGLATSDDALALLLGTVTIEKPNASPVVPAERRQKKLSIETVALDYMRAEFKKGQFKSATNFHKHLMETAGLNDSPFEKGKGSDARKLFCPPASSFFDAGTLGKIWAKIRTA